MLIFFYLKLIIYSKADVLNYCGTTVIFGITFSLIARLLNVLMNLIAQFSDVFKTANRIFICYCQCRLYKKTAAYNKIFFPVFADSFAASKIFTTIKLISNEEGSLASCTSPFNTADR